MEKARTGDGDTTSEPATSARDAERNSVSSAPASDEKPEYMKGLSLYMLTAGIWIALFLSTLETTIVSTSLVSIADSLSGFENRNWVVTAYFLTYTARQYFRVENHVPPRPDTVYGILNRLIILRAFQGMGGSGIYSMVLVIAPGLVPQTEYGKYIGIISSVFALASIVGPLVGGAISTTTTWRWVFLLNGPPGAASILLVAIFLPASKVEHSASSFATRLRAKFSRKSTQRVDTLGAFSLLAASVLLVFALESGGTRYEWDNAAIISTIVLSGLLWIVFIVQQMYLEHTKATREPIFPMGLLKNRLLVSMMFTTFFIGFPFVTILFTIPQQAQAVYGLSAIKASLSVLPLLLTSPAATAASGVLTSTFNVPPTYLIIAGAVIQFIGVGLAIKIPLTGDNISAQQYGFEAVMGVSFGLTLSTVLTLGQLIVSKENSGVVMGALTQIRVLGGTIALAICSAILSNHLKKNLAGVITTEELEDISETLASISSLGSERAAEVKYAFAVGYRKQFQLLTGFSGAAFLASLFLISRHPVTVRGVVSKNAPSSSSDSNESTLRAPSETPQAT
ncbi:hypothetical protein DL764_008178 [Monosporascus ibericus]|uniref:Major facilitator superfamily (MFS) profile domain-containing protein n=1 Tax=Monosporascus ibericus TaxID=155417 RepID=A0A4Q4T152_9PEZI|nr:hypothetical protein DL764_008178 [Monosporascus ibericus]